MSTTATAPAVRVSAPGAYDRVFYSGMALLIAATVFAGFSRTFYLRGYLGDSTTISGSTTLTPLAILHGAVFTAWVLLFVVQTSLVAARRVAVHRRLGVAGVVLAAIMVVVGVSTAIAAAARGSSPPFADPRTFLIVPLADMVLFAGFVTAAIVSRRNREAHKRLMLLAYVSIIVAAVARLPGMVGIAPFVSLVFLAMPIAYDLLSRRRVHPVYRWGASLIVLSLGRMAVAQTQAWQSFATWLIG